MKKLILGLLGLTLVSCAIAEQNEAEARKKGPNIRPPTFVINDATVNEDAGTVSLTISKTGNTSSASTVLVRTTNVTAVAGSDYNASTATLIFPASQTSQTVSVSLINDNVAESTETFRVNLTAGSNARIGDSVGVVTIVDTDAVTPPTQTCPDGSVILLSETCPEPEPAPEAPDPVETTDLDGAPDFNVTTDYLNAGVALSWGTGAIPGLYGGAINTTAGEGAFRFTCGGEGPVRYDDPLLYPNQPGASHLHKFSGPMGVTASTTPESLEGMTNSNCDYGTNVLNRSLYWMPALIDDQGYVRNPDWEAFYYKRITSANPRCNPAFAQAHVGAGGACLMLPNGIRFIFGWDPTNPNASTQGVSWYCTTGTGAHVANLDLLFQSGCVVGATMVADMGAPNCWNGTDLDTPNHRDHMAYDSYGNWGYLKCPDTHPYLIPQMETKKAWTVTQDMYHTVNGVIRSRIKLASDHMKTGAAPGSTMHADYMEKWARGAKDMWTNGCINQGLNCSGGDFGNGKQLIGSSEPSYGWVNPNPRTLIPTS
jgi:hypothetical protein